MNNSTYKAYMKRLSEIEAQLQPYSEKVFTSCVFLPANGRENRYVSMPDASLPIIEYDVTTQKVLPEYESIYARVERSQRLFGAIDDREGMEYDQGND